MNKKYIYIPFSFFIAFSMWLLSMEFPYYSLMIGFLKILSLAAVGSVTIALLVYKSYHKQLDGENMYTLTGMSWLFSFIILLSFISFFNRKYATNYCEIISMNVVDYKGRYTSGYGSLNKGKPAANQWILKLEIEEEVRQFVNQKDILKGKSVTRVMDFKFCKGILGTMYLTE